MGSLYDVFQAEFCPPLDTSLLAALVADLDLDPHGSGDGHPPPKEQVDALRSTLKELASQATAQYEHELCSELDSAHLSSHYLTTDDSNSSADLFRDTTESSTASDSSAFSLQSFSSPLGFLEAALPHIPRSRLRRALSECGAGDDGDFDMERIVESLLTNEFIRELEERGLDGLDDDDSPSPHGDEYLWKPVESKKKTSVNGKAAKKKNARGKTITLVDIRQKQHVPPPSLSTAAPAPDPWTQVSSLSEHLAALLPPHPASLFQSYFHSPDHSSPAKAIRAALSFITGAQKTSTASHPSTTPTLFTMLDVIRESPMYASLDPEQRSTLYTDAQLALLATHGRGDDAIDIVWLLLELDFDLESGSLAMGVYHFPQPQSPLSPSTSVPASMFVSPTSGKDRFGSVLPPSAQPPPTSKRKSMSMSSVPVASTATSQPSPFQWQTIPVKPPKGPHPLAHYIPAYDTSNQSRRSATSGRVRGTGNGFGKGEKGDIGELSRPDVRWRMAESMRKRDELLREASKAWRRGSSKTHGGEVALYFAERARGFQELARKEALNEARIMVEAKRSTSADRSTIDLHGTNISEAVTIVKEILGHEGCSAVNPLKIITGRGTHSAGGVGVLKPAVRSALLKDGWNVGVWDGGLVVRGRTPNRS